MQELKIKTIKKEEVEKDPRFPKLNRIKKTAGFISMFVLSIIGVITILSVIPFKGNIKLLTIYSGSMEPTIPVGSVAITKPATRYDVGDIISFSSGGKGIVTHRIADIDRGKAEIWTKGDANEQVDNKTIRPSNIQGKVMLWVPYIGYVINYTRTLPGLILLVIIPAVAIIGDELLEIKQNLNLITIRK